MSEFLSNLMQSLPNIFVIIFFELLLVYNGKSTVEFTLLHTGDLHSKYEGIARIVKHIKEERTSKSRTLYFDAGDIFTGSIWFYVNGWQIAAEFMKLLRPDAICIGNHEFDKGLKNLTKYIDFIGRKLLCANCDVSKEPQLKSRIEPVQILKIDGVDIGIIGYLAKVTETKYLFGNVRLLDEIEAVEKYVKQLKSKNIKIIILLGHGGYFMDKKIASKIEGIDLIVGGHSHTYLPQNKYPTIIKNPEGIEVPIVHAYADAKYIGKLSVTFDDAGNLKRWSGQPIEIDSSMKYDSEAYAILKKYNESIQIFKNTVVGHTKIRLETDGAVCLRRECNMGNFILDAFVHYIAEQRQHENWYHVAVGILNAGSMRASIAKGNITYADLFNVMPFANEIVVLRLNGSLLRQVLEFSPCGWRRGKFLQYSGVHVVYDYSKSDGEKVISAKIRCNDCPIPYYKVLNDTEDYLVVTLNFIANGGDNYEMLMGTQIENPVVTLDVDAVKDYLKFCKFVHPYEEERIIILKSNGVEIEPNLPVLIIFYINYLFLSSINLVFLYV